MAPESILPLGANLALFAFVLIRWWGLHRPERAPDRASHPMLILFATLQSSAVIWAVVRSGPLSMAYPWLATMLVIWVTVPLCFLLERTAASTAAGAMVVTLAFLIHSYALVLGPAPPQTDLAFSPFVQSPWYLLHVLGALLATGAYVCAAGGAIAYLGTAIRHRGAPSTIRATLRASELLSRRALAIALPSLTSSIFAYAFWTYLAWGNYWSWRPAGVCLLVLCLIIAMTLHIRTTTRWQGLTRASLTLVGLALALLSVPLLSQGLALFS
ncbi:MAG TPA: cytochrome c biogenesis protein CcsA [Anaerolineae bacterium]|nr:cytochrome c biogenesis protein CcsA [Anaerolineae bacterium]